jgi:hypothetical protein
MGFKISIGSFFEPSFGDGLEAAGDHVERFAFDYRSRHSKPVGAGWGDEPNSLKVGKLQAISLWGFVFPKLRMRISDVLGVIRLLSTYLTDPGHFLFLIALPSEPIDLTRTNGFRAEGRVRFPSRPGVGRWRRRRRRPFGRLGRFQVRLRLATQFFSGVLPGDRGKGSWLDRGRWPV